ncbi:MULTISPECIES: SLATT domain-containing protein [unclassified Streptomyces]|uniref:SLATT domain-containing protein n=1 Tax=unclassified Streptomyces TaxID=2593676 RepID=UPI000A50676E|nr:MULTISPECIES: SLATT domain-containing protein [unclassified Streptomyces]
MGEAVESKRNMSNLPKGAFPDFRDSGGAVEEARVLFRWAEREALDLHSWYLAEKKGKARTSKILRVFSVVMLAMGAAAPTIALLTNKMIHAEWGFIALAAGGAAVLLDKSFGFSASWTRYMTTAALLSRRIARAQADWMLWQLKDPGDLDELVSEIIAPFLDDVHGISESETVDWATTFGENLAELHSVLSDPPKA